MKLLWVGVLFLVAACGAVIKPPDPDRRLHVLTDGSLFESDRGYELAVLPDMTAKVVRLDVRYPVGAVDDPPGKEGLAHLVEHLLFDLQIQRDGKKTSIDAELGRLALSWNAETAEDYTDYQVTVAPEHLKEILGLEVDRVTVGCAGLSPAIIAREREVVMEELRERQGASGAQVRKLLDEQVFPEGHPYRPSDSVDSVAKLDMKDVCDFLAGPYHRGMARIVASGQVSQKTLQEAAAEPFARLRPRHEPTRAAIPPVTLKTEIIKAHADVDEPMLVMLFALPPESSHEYRLLDLVTGSIAPYWERSAFTFKWGHSAGTTFLGGAAQPVLAVSIQLDSADKLDDAVDAADGAVQNALYLGDKNDAGWQALWEGEAGALLARWESLGSRNDLMSDLLDQPQRAMLASRIDELHRASPGDVRGLAETWLARTKAKFVLIEPEAGKPVRPHAAYAGGQEALGVDVDGALADQPLPVPPTSTPLEIEQYKLGNGLNVILWPNAVSPLVYGRLVVLAGAAHDPKGAEGVSQLVGASDVNADDMVFASRELSIRVDDLVRELAWELRQPGYEVSDEQKQYMKARLRARGTAERVKYERDLMTAVYGEGHPYARPTMTADSVDKIHRDLVFDWARDKIVANNSFLIIAGQFDAELIKKHIAFNADQVKAGARAPVIKPAAKHLEAAWIEGHETRPSPTLEIDVAFTSGVGIDRDYAKRLVLQQVLENRLADLRAKSALTYGFNVTYDPRAGGGLWRISGEVDATRAAEAATAVAQILSDMRKSSESYRRAFVLARQKVLERLLVQGTGSLAVTARLVAIARFDLLPNAYDVIAKQVAGLTLATFAPFAASELDADDLVFGAYGNPEAAAAAIAAARQVQ